MGKYVSSRQGKMRTLEEIIVDYPNEEFIHIEGFEKCLLGVEDESRRLIYSVSACIEKFVAEGMVTQDAVEYFNFEVMGVITGEKRPIWCYD